MLTPEQMDAAREIRDELNKERLRDEVMLHVYQRQILTAHNKAAAEQNVAAKEAEIKAVKKLQQDLDDLIAQNS